MDDGREDFLNKINPAMGVLSNNDLDRVSSAIASLYAQRNAREFPSAVLEILSSIIPGEHSSYNEILGPNKPVRTLMNPEVPVMERILPAFQEHFEEHPYWKHHNCTGDRGVHKTTDFLTQREFRELGIYREFYRHVGTRVQMLFFLEDAAPALEIGIAINRASEFSERDRRVLELLRPHVSQARKNALLFANVRRKEELLEQTLGDLNLGLVELSEEERIKWLTPKAVELMESYFPGAMKNSGQLPDSLQRWFKQTNLHLSTSQLPQPFWCAKEDSTLRVVFQRMPGGGVQLLMSEALPLTSTAGLHHFGLTTRETEVMHWITEGKSNPDIAIILKVSVRTIHKHVENLMKKLGVETRNAVTRRVLEIRGLV